MDNTISFFARLVLALKTLFKIVFQPGYAARVVALEAAGSEPQAPSKLPTVQTGDEPARAASEPPQDSSDALEPEVTGALQLLRILQREGRFIDFIEQDIEGFPDADVGTAARVVHSGCRVALHAQMKLATISTTQEDQPASLRDAREVQSGRWKLTGNVSGTPPHRGVVRHCGWLVEECHLPKSVGHDDARILCPAELETS